MSPWNKLVCAVALVGAISLPPAAHAGGGNSQIACSIKENASSATGTLVVTKDGARVHAGACTGAVPIPPGSYNVVVGLDGALDGPEQAFNVNVRAGQTESVSADFATGVLQVRIESEGQQAAGMAIIRRNGKQLGTLGSGVSAHLSVGTYEVIARYRIKSQEFGSVSITRAQTTTLDARF